MRASPYLDDRFQLQLLEGLQSAVCHLALLRCVMLFTCIGGQSLNISHSTPWSRLLFSNLQTAGCHESLLNLL